MTMKILVAILVAVIVGSGVFVIASTEDTSENAQDALSTVQENEQLETTQESENETNAAEELQDTSQLEGSYINYSETALADAEGTDRILFFHAEWCSTCKFYENDIMQSGVPSGVTVIEADFDTNTELKDRYGVTVQSTFVLLNDEGEVVRTWPFASGLRSAQDLFDAVASEA